jgi:uncharacterized protein
MVEKYLDEKIEEVEKLIKRYYKDMIYEEREEFIQAISDCIVNLDPVLDDVNQRFDKLDEDYESEEEDFCGINEEDY